MTDQNIEGKSKKKTERVPHSEQVSLASITEDEQSGRFPVFVAAETKDKEAPAQVVPVRGTGSGLARDTNSLDAGQVKPLAQVGQQVTTGTELKTEKSQAPKVDSNASEIAWRDAELARLKKAEDIAAQERAMHSSTSGRQIEPAPKLDTVKTDAPVKINSNESEIAWRAKELAAAQERQRIAEQEKAMHAATAGRLSEPLQTSLVPATETKAGPKLAATPADALKLDPKSVKADQAPPGLAAAATPLDKQSHPRGELPAIAGDARPIKQNAQGEAPHAVSGNTRISDQKLDGSAVLNKDNRQVAAEPVKQIIDKNAVASMRQVSPVDLDKVRQNLVLDNTLKALSLEKIAKVDNSLLALKSSVQAQVYLLDTDRRNRDLLVQHGVGISIGAPLAILLRAPGSSFENGGAVKAVDQAKPAAEALLLLGSKGIGGKFSVAGADSDQRIGLLAASQGQAKLILSSVEVNGAKNTVPLSLIPKGIVQPLAGNLSSDARGPAYVVASNGIKAVTTQIAAPLSAKGVESAANPALIGRPLVLQAIEPIGGKSPLPVSIKSADAAVRYVPIGLQTDAVALPPAKLGARIASLQGIDERRMPGVEIVMGALITSTAIAKARRGNHASERVDSQESDSRSPATWLDLVLQEQLRKRKVEQAQKYGAELSQSELEKLDFEEADALDKDPIIFALQLFNDHLKAARQRYKKESDSKAEKLELEIEKVESSSSSAFVNWQEQARSGPIREKHLVERDENLERLAESLYNDRRVAWLIADLNSDRIKDNNLDDQRVVELFVGQVLELPNLEEVQKFLQDAARKSLVFAKLVTIVSITSENASVIRDILGKII